MATRPPFIGMDVHYRPAVDASDAPADPGAVITPTVGKVTNVALTATGYQVNLTLFPDGAAPEFLQAVPYSDFDTGQPGTCFVNRHQYPPAAGAAPG